MDVREIYGASPWQRQNLTAEEAVRLAHAALMSGMVFALPAEVTEASPDGHSVTVRPTVRKAVLDPVTGQRSYQDHPIAPDTPIHYPGGGGTVLTHGLGVGDEIANLYFSRNIDGWRQLGGSQQPYDDVQNHLGDSVAIPGIRSNPRKLQQVAPDAMHARDEKKHAVHEVKPGVGTQSFHADPSTPPASDTFDPLSQATKFVRHLSQSAAGAVGEAVDGGTRHSHGSFHGIGSWLKAMAPSGLMQALAHPALGALISAADGKHSVTATSGGVMLQSATSISFDCPKGGLNLPVGGISGGAVQGGGDISGTLNQAKVVSLANVDARTLPLATSDVQAAAAGVPVGGLYRDTSVTAGKTVIVMRAA